MIKKVFTGVILALTMGISVYGKEKAPTSEVFVYKKDGRINREMMIHFPGDHDRSSMAVPGIIMFHGGGWASGSRDEFTDLCRYFAGRGLVAATVSYKLTTKRGKYKGEGSRKRVCVSDAKSAIRWYKQQAKKLGVDPKRIIAGGSSAGGHIALLATTNPGLNAPGDPKDVDTSVAAYLLFNPALNPGDAGDPEVDVLKHLPKGLPPSIAFFGSKDWWLKGWKTARKRMKSLGTISNELWIAEGMGHSFFNKAPWKDITLHAADLFLVKHGFLKGKSTIKLPDPDKKLVLRP